MDRLIENIAKHLGSGNAIRTADWELNKLQEMGKLTEENAKIINATLKSLPNVIKEALSDASKEALADIDQIDRRSNHKRSHRAGTGNLYQAKYLNSFPSRRWMMQT